MRSVIAIMLMTGLATVACSKTDDKSTTTTSASVGTPGSGAAVTTAAVTAAPTQAAPTTITPSADMTAFMAMLDGKGDSARKALKKYGANATIQGDDVGMYTLTSPKITKAEKSGDLQCFTMESTAGVMKHTTQTCWDAKGKISKITDTSE